MLQLQFHREQNAKRNTTPTLVKRKFGKQATTSDIIIWKVQAPEKKFGPMPSNSRPGQQKISS